MRKIEVCLPFGLPPPELGADLLRQTNAPALARLLSRSKSRSLTQFEEFSRTLPHERWLGQHLGCEREDYATDSPPAAGIPIRQFDLAADEGCWFLLQPAMLHVARDHLVLTDLRRLQLAEAESRSLFEAAREACEESGLTLLYGDAKTWLLRADTWNALKTSTPDSACGRNIDIWMPTGPGEREWRRLLNEVQMRWHAHPVNEARAQQGDNPVNSMWLWGRTDQTAIHGVQGKPKLAGLYGKVWSLRREPMITPQTLAQAEHPLLLLDSLIEPALADDWAAWLEALRVLDVEWFAPLLELLQEGAIDEIEFALGGASRMLATRCTRLSLKKFWILASLSPLIP
jgi:hypothetical protein